MLKKLASPTRRRKGGGLESKTLRRFAPKAAKRLFSGKEGTRKEGTRKEETVFRRLEWDRRELSDMSQVFPLLLPGGSPYVTQQKEQKTGRTPTSPFRP